VLTDAEAGTKLAAKRFCITGTEIRRHLSEAIDVTTLCLSGLAASAILPGLFPAKRFSGSSTSGE